ncbi:MAG: Tm-1-like ATP-binding domain-containing protein [Thermodesulfobacteriota bacterium]
MPPNVVIVGTLDTKWAEVDYLRSVIAQSGCAATVVDVGTLHPPGIRPDVSREEVASAAGMSLDEVLQIKDRRVAVGTMTKGASEIAVELLRRGKLSAIVSVGGGTGTHIGTGVMRSLPLGVPKLMVSTVASRDMSELIGTKDITIMHSVIDILGLNSVSRRILANAGAAIAGMALQAGEIRPEKPIVGLTSFGFITEGAMQVKRLLEANGYEVAPFHANGTGGMAMEDLIDQGLIHGVIDFALHEFSDQLYGGYCGAIGEGRLESAGRRGIPQVVVPGGLDCIVLEFDSLETMPEPVKGRKVFWYDFRSGVRTSAEDVMVLARTIARKLNRAQGPTRFLIPMGGWSEADAVGGPLYEPAVNQVFVDEIRSLLDPRVEVIEVDAHINDDSFAHAAVNTLKTLMK